jgi:hypothetical protein
VETENYALRGSERFRQIVETVINYKQRPQLSSGLDMPSSGVLQLLTHIPDARSGRDGGRHKTKRARPNLYGYASTAYVRNHWRTRETERIIVWPLRLKPKYCLFDCVSVLYRAYSSTPDYDLDKIPAVLNFVYLFSNLLLLLLCPLFVALPHSFTIRLILFLGKLLILSTSYRFVKGIVFRLTHTWIEGRNNVDFCLPP